MASLTLVAISNKCKSMSVESKAGGWRVYFGYSITRRKGTAWSFGLPTITE